MRHLQISLLFLVVAFATGCPKPHYRPTVNFDQGMVDKFNAALKRQYREYECFRFGPSHIDFQGNACTGFVENADKARIVRNELIENALPYIDEAYLAFITDLQAGRDRNNFILDLVELGTAASVGITNGERPLQIIGVALTAFRGGRRSIDANFYKDTSLPILISKMDGNRAKVRGIILERQGKEANDYPLGAAVSDIVDYYNAGTLVRAFTQLEQDTARITEASETRLADIKRQLGVKGAPTAEDLKRSNQNAQALRALRLAFRAEDKKVKDAETTITTAEQGIASAEADITAADQGIGVATAELGAAKTNTAKLTAEAKKATAEANKVKAQAVKTTAEGKKATAEAAKASATTAREQAFKNLRATYDAIASDAKLGPVLQTVPESDPNIQPARKAALQAMLQRNQGRPEPTTDAERDTAVNEYTTILHEFAAIVVAKFKEEPELNERLQEILKANE